MVDSNEIDADVRQRSWDCVVGLGSNQGDSLEHLRRAALSLSLRTDVRCASSLYKTEPVGGPPQPPYLNAALRIRHDGSALELLGQLQALERAAGRERLERWGPRTLDLDILWIDGFCCHHPDLQVPHPRLVVRAFALRPLLDVAASARDPRTGVAYADHLRRMGVAPVVPVVRGGSWSLSSEPGHAPLDAASAIRDRALDRVVS